MRNEELARILIERSYLGRKPDELPFVLASGKTSYHYFDADRTTSFAPALPLIARAFYEKLELPVQAVGGPPRGADPIAIAISYYSMLQGHPIHVFSVRKQLKDHGIPGWIEGSAQPGDRVAFVEDVVTTGSSCIQALTNCREAGLQVTQVLVLVDREEQDGMQRIREASGVPVDAIFRYSELMQLAPCVPT